jgi:hypothetical protein
MTEQFWLPISMVLVVFLLYIQFVIRTNRSIISVVFAAEQVSGLIAGDLRHFVREFETQFAEILRQPTYDISRFRTTDLLIKKRFPYLE